MNHLKIKIFILLTLLVLFVSATLAGYIIYAESKATQKHIFDAKKAVKNNYDNIIDEFVVFFQARTQGMLQSQGILASIEAKDHEQLLELTKNKLLTLQKENPFIDVIQFHNADGTSLLRLHQPDFYGDAIAQLRPMLQVIHAKHEEIHTFEEGRAGYVFRIAFPIFDAKQNYLGALEYGVSTRYISQELKRRTGFDSVFFTKRTNLTQFQDIFHEVTLGEYVSVAIQESLNAFIQSYSSQIASIQDAFFTHKDKTYYSTTIPIKDFNNQELGVILFFDTMEDINDYIAKTVVSFFFITLFITAAVLLFANFIYNLVYTKITFQELYNQAIIDAIPSMVIATDGKNLVAANQAFLDYLEYKNIQKFHKEHDCICDFFEPGDTDEYIMSSMNGVIWTDYIFSTPHKNHKVKITINQTTSIFDIKLSKLSYQNFLRYVVVFTDISNIQTLSMNDALTGIANRLHFNMVYEHIYSMAKRENTHLSIIFFDIDFFKKINDTYGHLTGDEILKSIASLVNDTIRKSDVFARWGGEEFVLLLPNTKLEYAYEVAESLREKIENAHFSNGINVTCSFGVAGVRDKESSHDFLLRVDSLLYEAKDAGRNVVIQ
jgi:diguanylate cyclase (GGDEF)-like protein